MSKKFIFVLAVVVFFFGFKFASAESLIINEIMYDLSGSDTTDSKSREWVEIYNSGPEITIDASKWRFYDGSNNRTINGEEDFTVPADAYIVLAGDKTTFLSDHSGFSGIVYDTGMTSLNNTGKTLEILDQDGNPVDSVDYSSSDGANGDGNSLQLINGEWKASSPTPGVSNQDSGDEGSGDEEENTDEENTTDEDSSSDSESATETKATATPTLKTKILAKTLAFAGQPAEFSLDVKYGSLTYTTGKYFWNFGDGDSREVINQPGRIFHTYFYPGEYAVSSEYYKSYLSQVPDVVSKITIKVVPLTVSISKVGDAKDFFIELTNNSSYEIDISRWAINANGKVFVFPKNTAILSKKQTTVSGRITGFVSGDERNLKLISSAGDVVFDYNPPIVQTEIIKEAPAPVSAPVKIPTVETQNNNVVEVETPEVEIPDQTQILPTQIPADILPAAVVQSDIDVKESSNKYLFLGGLAGFLIITGGFVYFLRRNRVPANLKEGSDFKILDE